MQWKEVNGNSFNSIVFVVLVSCTMAFDELHCGDGDVKDKYV